MNEKQLILEAMKKFFLTMMFAVAAMAGMSQTIGEAFYIYRNKNTL